MNKLANGLTLMKGKGDDDFSFAIDRKGNIHELQSEPDQNGIIQSYDMVMDRTTAIKVADYLIKMDEARLEYVKAQAVMSAAEDKWDQANIELHRLNISRHEIEMEGSVEDDYAPIIKVGCNSVTLKSVKTIAALLKRKR